MPEGPEVFKVTEGLQHFVGLRVGKIEVVSGRYARDVHALQGLEAILGEELKRVTCKGKLIVLHFETLRGFETVPIAILSTLGMTGDWAHGETRHTRIAITFEGGTELFFNDQRNFGTFKVVSYKEMKRKLAELGPDILTPAKLWDAISLPEFRARIARFGKNASVAEGLLDQRIAAGCGNYIRAEAMYLAQLSPHRRMSELTPREVSALWSSLAAVALLALHDKLELHCYGRETDPWGQPIEHFEDKNGRRVWWCQKVQS
jgi:formamidopyrimidine-DNA glycosylase